MSRPLDPFAMLARQLAGRPVEPPPDIPGRRIEARDDLHRAYDLPQLTAGEVADICGITFNAAKLRIAIAAESGDWSALLARPQEVKKPRGRRAKAAAATPTTSSTIDAQRQSRPQGKGATAP